MFTRFKKFISELSFENTSAIFGVTLFMALITWTLSNKLQEGKYDIPAILDYTLWLSDSTHYFLYRFWSWVPYFVLAVSVVGITKTLITGKCSILKGLSFGDLVFINSMTVTIFLIPLAIEGALYVAAIVTIILAMLKAFSATITRYDNACAIKQEDEEDNKDEHQQAE